MIYLIAPVYNEKETIEKIIYNSQVILKGQGFNFIVIDDGSQDGTREILQKLDYNNVSIVTHNKNLGLHKALESGLKCANKQSNLGDIIVTMEGDNTSDLAILPKMIAKINEGYDIVIASRNIRGGKYIGMPYYRMLLSVFSNKIMSKLFAIKGVTDYTIFYKAYKANIIKEAFKSFGNNLIKINGFVANIELLLILNRLGIKIFEVPFEYDYRKKISRSKFSVFKNILPFLFLLTNVKKLNQK